jgi:pyridoxine 5-phosphate synthase
MTKLSVNVNKIALLRNQRGVGYPSVVECAKICLDAGAAGITVHPRPDQRHIRPGDVYELAELLRSYPSAEFNIEGNPFYEYLSYARDVKPTQCTLVPDSPEASTSDHGWDIVRDSPRLMPCVDEIKSVGSRVSLFMDAHAQTMIEAKQLGADRVELYTEPYAHGFATGNLNAVDPFAEAAKRAAEVGLGVNAGHDLSLDNLGFFLERVPNVLEVSIGHAFVSDALKFGLSETTKKYCAICEGA